MFNTSVAIRCRQIVLASLCASAPALAMNPVPPPNFPLANVALYCSAVWPNAGSSVWESAQGDYNTNVCAAAPGATFVRTGLLTNDFWNIAETWCDPYYYWISETWGGHAALTNDIIDSVNTTTGGNCSSRITIGASLRGAEDVIGASGYWSDPANGFKIPSPAAYDHTGKTFNATFFVNHIMAELQKSPPVGYSQPVGYQLSVRAPLSGPSPAPLNADVLVDLAVGNVVGYKPLPSGAYNAANGYPFNPGNGYVGTTNGTSATDLGNPPMDVNRRFDSASTAKTITAVGIVAALEELAQHGNPQHVTLESSINPYLQMIWPGGVDASLQTITFRDLLQQTTPLCLNTIKGGDSYASLKILVALPPPPGGYPAWQPGTTEGQPGIATYCDANYSLARILLALLVEGPQAFRNPNGTLKSGAEIDELTAVSYRNYIRSKIFAPIYLSSVDVFYTGSLPETIYFGSNYLSNNPNPGAAVAIPDQINVGVGANYGPDQRANFAVRNVGSGLWNLSAKEYSLFIANLWAGRIIPLSAVQKMITAYPMGIELGSLAANGMTTFGKNGGGGYGGPANQWVTFPDGTTAVLVANSFAGDITFRAMLEKWYDPSWQ